MGWFKVHSDDLHKVKALDLSREPIEEVDSPAPEPVKVKTKDVTMFIASYRSDIGLGSYYGLSDRPIYINGEVMTRTNARDAFLKGVQELMDVRGFDPMQRYTIEVDKKLVKEPV